MDEEAESDVILPAMVVSSCTAAEWGEHGGQRYPMYYEVTMESSRQPVAKLSFYSGRPYEVGKLYRCSVVELDPMP